MIKKIVFLFTCIFPLTAMAVPIITELDITGSGNYTQTGDIDTTKIITGNIDWFGNFTLGTLGQTELATGAIIGSGNTDIYGTKMDLGAVTNNSGTMDIGASGTLNMGQFINADNNIADASNIAVITANGITSGSIQNNIGTTTIASGSGIDSTGNVENSGIGTKLKITGGAMTVAGTMKNDNPLGTMELTLDSLTVSGGDALNASFVNMGNFNADITGNTYLAYGFDLTTMGTTNTFSLKTGTLEFDGTNSVILKESWARLLTNKIDSFYLLIRDGVILTDAGITNGGGNASANMRITAKSVDVLNVHNTHGILTINATDVNGAINITDDITGALGSITDIISAGDLTVGGTVSNAGTMTLDGLTVGLDSIANTDGVLRILAPTSTGGKITMSGGITNTTGTTELNAHDITITGLVTNNSGTTTINGSDSGGAPMSIGGIDATGGAINLDAIIGSISITGGINISAGALNLGPNTKEIIAKNSIIADNLIVGSNLGIDRAAGLLMKSTTGSITITGNLENNTGKKITLDAGLMGVGGDVIAGNSGRITIGDTLKTQFDVVGNLSADSGGVIDLNVATTNLGSLDQLSGGKIIARGSEVSSAGAINILNGIWFDGTSNPTMGFVVLGTTNNLILQTIDSGADISIAGGIFLGTGKTLAINSADMLNISGNVSTAGTLNIDSTDATTFANQITNTGTMTVDGKTIATADIINNSGSVIMTATGAGTGGNITTGAITNTGAGSVMTINAGTAGTVSASAISSSAGGMNITGDSLSGTLISITGGYANLNTDLITAIGAITTSGNLTQGGTSGMLNLTKNNTVLNAGSLTIDGDFNAVANSAEYNIANEFKVIGNMTIASGAVTNISAESISSADVENIGTLDLIANDITLSDVINSGTMDINSGTVNSLTVNSFTTTGGTATLSGTGINSVGAIDLSGKLHQNFAGTLSAGDLNIVSSDYTIGASSLSAVGITQTSGKMVINTSDINIAGDISATDLRIDAGGANLTAAISGDVSGDTKFIGLEHMTVGGNYTFNDNSIIMANILKRGETSHNYWATLSLEPDDTLGTITNGVNAEPLMLINGSFISNMSAGNSTSAGAEILNGQIGVNITDTVDMGTAIWLVHADDGIIDANEKIRNAVVRFCNSSGTLCYNYLDSLGGSTNPDGLPVFLSMRDTDGDGVADDIYLVFNPEFGGPVEIFKIAPIVYKEAGSTDGEYATAGALDNLIAGRLVETDFHNGTAIELIPVIFKDTNMEEMSQQLYDRMEQYQLDLDGTALVRFSRLFQPREMERIASAIALNEHTTFRDIEDRMFDEFIWNRHRNLKKSWLDIDFGAITQKDTDGMKNDATRFGLSGGFDWAESKTLILGLTAHASNTSGDSTDIIDLGYKPGKPIAGRVDLDTSITNIGVGGYMMKTLSEKSRLYGNAFLDLNMIDITREQNFMGTIEGSGTSVSVIAEFGLLHDILNQYFVGNIYARAGYNFGFAVNETAAGSDYMDLESSGYLILTPGYSLTAQKRFYTSPWFQIRPYISAGAEYDVLGTPDTAQFKFSSATEFTDYEIEISPLWMNVGGGAEFISMSGIQFGLDYRYQHNADIQMHKIKLSGSYRF